MCINIQYIFTLLDNLEGGRVGEGGSAGGREVERG